MEQEKLSFIAGGSKIQYDHTGRQFGNFYKTKHIITHNAAIAVPGIYPNELKNL